MINHEDYLPVFKHQNEHVLRQPYDEYLRIMGESRADAVKRLNKYCLVPYTHNIFDFLDDNLIRWINGEKLIYTEFNFYGGRYGKKTFEIANYIAKTIVIAHTYNKKVAIYCFRLFGSALGDLRDEIDNALERYHLNESHSKQTFLDGEYIYSNTWNKPKWKFINGSFITLTGIYKANDRTIALKGLASAQDFDLAITFNEEANEFTNKDNQAIRIALRGAKEQVYFSAANPDLLENDYIWYGSQNLPFNREELEKTGYQFKKLIDPDTGRGKVFMITNWMVNPYLKEPQIQEMLELKKNDKYKYEIWGIGMPGSLQTAVFAPYVFDKDKTFLGNQLIAGIDLGYATSSMGHPTRVVVLEMDLEHKRLHPIAEYSHSNATDTHKDIQEIKQDIIQFFINLANQPQYRYLREQGISVQVDYGAGGYPQIDELNNKCRTIFDTHIYGMVSEWLHFVPTDKQIWLIKDRIEITISLLNTAKLTISKTDTPVLYNEMKLISYKKPTGMQQVNTEPKMLDVNDDGWDAMMYAIMPYAQQLLQEWQNSGLYNKQYQRLMANGTFKPDNQKW